MAEKKKEPQHSLGLALQSLEGDKVRVEVSLFKGLEPKRGEEVELWAGTLDFPRGEMIGSYMLEADGRKREDVPRPDKAHTNLSVVWGPLTVSKPVPDALKAKTGNRLSCIKRIIDSTPGLLFLIFTADAVLSAGVPVRFRYCGETSWVESNTFDVSLGPVSERIVEVTVPRSIDHIVVTSEVTNEQRAINFWWPEVSR